MAVRVVFDTNTVLSALLFGRGRLAWLRQVWSQGMVVPIVSAATRAEIERVLAYPKFRLSMAEQASLLDDYLPFCEMVVIHDPPPAVPDCRDVKDLPFLWLAIVGRADYLVTGDQDLLVLVDDFPVVIVTPAVFQSVLMPGG
jgi:uncharacterized protein